MSELSIGRIGATPGPWADRFRDLPLLGGLVELPVHDGDMAELHGLAHQVYDAIEDVARPEDPAEVMRDGTPLYQQLCRDAYQLGMELEWWPIDHAAHLIEAWSDEAEGIAA